MRREEWRQFLEQPEQKRIDRLARLAGCPPYVGVETWLIEQGLASRPNGFAGSLVFPVTAERLLAAAARFSEEQIKQIQRKHWGSMNKRPRNVNKRARHD
jgi:hypothetical protein